MQNADFIRHQRRAWLYGGLCKRFQFLWPISGQPQRGHYPLCQPCARPNVNPPIVGGKNHSEHSDNETIFYEEVEWWYNLLCTANLQIMSRIFKYCYWPLILKTRIIPKSEEFKGYVKILETSRNGSRSTPISSPGWNAGTFRIRP